MFCKNCGAKLAKGNLFCNECGTAVETRDKPKKAYQRKYVLSQ